MRLLFLSTAGHFGGTERWTSMAITELQRRGHEVWMDCPDLPHAGQFIASDRLSHDGPTGMFDAAGTSRLAAFCRKHAIDALIPVSQRAYFLAGQVAHRLGLACMLRLGIVRLPWRPASLVGGHVGFLRDGENGYVARSRIPKRVAKDLERILYYDHLADAGKQAAETLRQLFDLERMGDQFDALLLNV